MREACELEWRGIDERFVFRTHGRDAGATSRKRRDGWAGRRGGTGAGPGIRRGSLTGRGEHAAGAAVGDRVAGGGAPDVAAVDLDAGGGLEPGADVAAAVGVEVRDRDVGRVHQGEDA